MFNVVFGFVVFCVVSGCGVFWHLALALCSMLWVVMRCCVFLFVCLFVVVFSFVVLSCCVCDCWFIVFVLWFCFVRLCVFFVYVWFCGIGLVLRLDCMSVFYVLFFFFLSDVCVKTQNDAYTTVFVVTQDARWHLTHSGVNKTLH